MRNKAKLRKGKKAAEIKDYDDFDTTGMIDSNRPLDLEALGFKLPERAPTEVVSIRLPSELLNQLRSIGSQRDIPYQALIKLYLAEAVERKQRPTR